MTVVAPASASQSDLLKPFWSSLLGPPWLVALVFFAVIAAARFIAMLSPYSLQELYFVQSALMWALPFIVLTPVGRRQIGLTEHGATVFNMLYGVLAGCACGVALFATGMMLFGSSQDNWCISIRTYLHFEEMRGMVSPLGIFAIYAIPAVLLNPVGEEFLFRGVLQQSFALRIQPALATLASSILFGMIYLPLHGIWRDASGYHVHLLSATIALCLMACVGAVFSQCRRLSGSLWTAVAAHAAFNLTVLGATLYQYSR